MNLRIKNRCWIFTIIWLVVLLFSVSCNGNRPEKEDTYWFEDGKGTINTNDLPRLQKQVPFEIILPKYLPDHDNSSETRFHLTTSTILGTGYKLFIFEYFSENYSKSLTISQQQIPIDTTINLVDYPDSENDNIFLHKDIIIWEEVIKSTYSHNRYEWCYKGIWFHANFLDYTQDESREIIRSMIE